MGRQDEIKTVLSSKLSGGPHGLGKPTMKFIPIEPNYLRFFSELHMFFFFFSKQNDYRKIRPFQAIQMIKPFEHPKSRC